MNAIKSSFGGLYKDKKVLVTGHTGFKGSWLTLWLNELGADVIGYSLEPPTNPSLFKILRLDKKITHIIGDVRDEKKIKEIFKKYKPEIVFHLAAQPLVRYSYKYPKLTYETNIMGTVNTFEAARETKSVKVIINITTDKCYKNKELTAGYKENDPMGGYDPYSSSKGCSELITSAYRNSFFNPKDFKEKHNVIISSVRAGNVIGGGDWADDRLIPDCIRALTKNKTLIIRSPNAVRPWQYVLEPLSGYLHLGSMMWNKGIKYGQAWNFGPEENDVLSVEEILKKVINIFGKGNYKVKEENKLHETKLLMLNIKKAKDLLKWRPIYNVNESIKKTIEWYRNYYNNSTDMNNYSLNQIKQYTNKAIEKGVEWAKNNGADNENKRKKF